MVLLTLLSVALVLVVVVVTAAYVVLLERARKLEERLRQHEDWIVKLLMLRCATRNAAMKLWLSTALPVLEDPLAWQKLPGAAADGIGAFNLDPYQEGHVCNFYDSHEAEVDAQVPDGGIRIKLVCAYGMLIAKNARWFFDRLELPPREDWPNTLKEFPEFSDVGGFNVDDFQRFLNDLPCGLNLPSFSWPPVCGTGEGWKPAQV